MPPSRRPRARALDAAGPEPIDRIRAGRAAGAGPGPIRGSRGRNRGLHAAGRRGDVRRGERRLKDKGTLFRRCSPSAGSGSYPILINGDGIRHRRRLGPRSRLVRPFHRRSRVAQGPAGPAGGRPGEAIEVEGIGKVLVVDTTDEYCWPGTIPSNISGHRGLLVADSRGILVTMPPGDPGPRIASRGTAVVTVRPDGTASVRLDVAYFGSPAEEARVGVAYRGSVVDRRKDVEDAVRAAWTASEVRKSYDVVLERKDGAYVETISFEVPAASPALGEGGLPVFAGATLDLPRVPARNGGR